MIVMINERFDLRFQVYWEEIVFEYDAVLQGLVPSLDLALRLWMLWRTPDVPHFLIAKPFSQLARYITGTVVR